MSKKEPNLKYATTRELLRELSSRGKAIGDKMGHARNGTMGGYLEAAADEILTHLNSGMLNYRTADDNDNGTS